MLNKNIVNLSDDIFWNMGFTTQRRRPRQIRLCLSYYTHYFDFKTYTHYSQVRQVLRLADHVWQDKMTLIAQSVDKLGDQFRPAMRAGWLSYICRAYPDDGAADAGPIVGEGILVQLA